MKTFCLSAITAPLLSSHATIVLAADEAKSNTAKTLNSQPIASGALLETIIGLALILALIFALAWLIRRTGKFQTSSNGEIKMIAGLSLGQRERAVLLEIEGERILVGVTSQQIQTLHVLGQQNTSQETYDTDKYAQFDHQLQSMIKKEQQDD